MAITDKERRDLFTAFEEWMGTDNANTAMELLPTQPADQLVTRSDLHAFGAELRAEMIDRFATAKVETQRLIIAGMVGNAIAVITALAA